MPRVRAARQRRVLLPDHHTVRPVAGTHRDVAGVAAKPASELRIADDHEGAGFRDLVKVCHSLGLRVAVVHQPVLALEVRRGIGVERLVAVKQDPAFEMQELERLEPDPGNSLSVASLTGQAFDQPVRTTTTKPSGMWPCSRVKQDQELRET